MNKDERMVFNVLIAIFAVIIGYGISTKAYEHFIETGATPDYAVAGSIAVFALVLGAFGLVAVKVNL